MNNIQKYFDAPIFESKKSLYAVRYQNDLEHKLIKMFEAERRIRSYHQPILSALVKTEFEKFFINIDFWVEDVSGKVELVYLATEFDFPEQAEIRLSTNSCGLLNHEKLSFALVIRNKFRRIEVKNLKLDVGNKYFDNNCFVNFGYIN